MQILLFGQLTDLVGAETVEIKHAKNTTHLLEQLYQQYPALIGATFMLAVDKQVVPDDMALSEHSTIALLPPFSGG